MRGGSTGNAMTEKIIESEDIIERLGRVVHDARAEAEKASGAEQDFYRLAERFYGDVGVELGTGEPLDRALASASLKITNSDSQLNHEGKILISTMLQAELHKMTEDSDYTPDIKKIYSDTLEVNPTLFPPSLSVVSNTNEAAIACT